MELFFYKGKENILENTKGISFEPSSSETKKIQDSFLKVLDNKNLSFLLGSGCSSFKVSEYGFIELGISVMAPLANEFYTDTDFIEEKEWLKRVLKIDVENPVFSKNLEVFLSTLHSLHFYSSKVAKQELFDFETAKFSDLNKSQKIEYIIRRARNFILKKCLNEVKNDDKPLVDLYEQFYKKLLSRNSTLPRLNIFTTNYDLYSEKAMDLLGIHYANGFTGGISKFFNPAIFNYALAEKMDLSQTKWSVIDNFFYLYKIHGSVNWVEAEGENKLFKVREIQDTTFEKLKNESNIMIHPTPLKYNASLGSPYSDLFREFQKKLMQNNNILVTIGYSFSDEHINNLIFQAFTIPSFRLIVIGEPVISEDGEKNNIQKLLDLNDSRIWIIGEKWPEGETDYVPIHFFQRFVEEILPDLTAEDLDEKMQTTIQGLKDFLK